jgi:hypothetical protein
VEEVEHAEQTEDEDGLLGSAGRRQPRRELGGLGEHRLEDLRPAVVEAHAPPGGSDLWRRPSLLAEHGAGLEDEPLRSCLDHGGRVGIRQRGEDVAERRAPVQHRQEGAARFVRRRDSHEGERIDEVRHESLPPVLGGQNDLTSGRARPERGTSACLTRMGG